MFVVRTPLQLILTLGGPSNQFFEAWLHRSMYDKKLIQVYSVGQVKNGPTVACTDDNLTHSSSLGC